MKTLIKHLLHNNIDEILSKSFLNCHCKGVHSIMLIDSPEKTIRLYIADINHEMDVNHPFNFIDGKMSIGFHSHHCNLTLEVIKGIISNWIVEKNLDGPFNVNSWLYKSKITKGETSFSLIEENIKLKKIKFETLNVGDFTMMKASDIHTIACPKNIISGWLVFEGKEDPNYNPICYSNNDLTKIDVNDLYTKPNYEDIIRLLKLVELID